MPVPLRVDAEGRGERADLGLEPVVLVVGPLEDRDQAVIVAVRDRVELVGVAAGTLQRQPHHGRAQDVDLVGDHLEPVGEEAGDVRPGRVGGHAQEAGRDQVVVDLRRDLRRVLVVGQFVAGDLFEEEPVVRLVGVERPDDVVAIALGVRPGQVLLALPLRVGIAGQVEPVPSPALAISGRREQAVDHRLVRVRARDRRGTPRPRPAREAARSGRTRRAGGASSRPPRARGRGPSARASGG